MNLFEFAIARYVHVLRAQELLRPLTRDERIVLTVTEQTLQRIEVREALAEQKRGRQS
jgi:hypothetical protein